MVNIPELWRGRSWLLWSGYHPGRAAREKKEQEAREAKALSLEFLLLFIAVSQTEAQEVCGEVSENYVE